MVNMYLFIRFLMGNIDVDSEIRFLEMILFVRALKILQILKEVYHFRLIADTFEALINPFLTLLLTLFCLYYFWAMIGDSFFGGQVFNDDLRILSDVAVPNDFRLMNMNDFLSSFITLFALMIINNWYVIVNLFTVVKENNFYRWFFITFYFFCVIIFLNIVVAFVIDMYGNVSDL